MIQNVVLFLAQFITALEPRSKDYYADLVPYMDIEYTIGGERNVSRIHVELFWDVTPKTAMNFARILEGSVIKNGVTMAYKDTSIHRIIPGFMMQGGDFQYSNGTGGYSIWKENTFPDENFTMKHSGPGILSMANAGKNTNGSQFFITYAACPHLDGYHTVFGKVKGAADLRELRRIEKVKIRKRRDSPVNPVTIIDCGFMKKDEYKPVL